MTQAQNALIDLFHSVKPRDAEERPIGGSPAAAVGGNVFMRIRRQEFVLRLGEADRKELLAVDGAHPFEAIPGRPMPEYVVVPPSLLADTPELARWAKRSYDYAATLVTQEASGVPQAKPRQQVAATVQIPRVKD